MAQAKESTEQAKPVESSKQDTTNNDNTNKDDKSEKKEEKKEPSKISQFWEKTKEKAAETGAKLKQRLSMEGLLTQANESLELFFKEKKIKKENEISQSCLHKCTGIVLITEVKGGFLFGVKGGSGIIITRLDDGNNLEPKWSHPCAIGTGGISFGFQAGATKIDHIVILHFPEHVNMFMKKGQLQLKGSASATVIKDGRNAEVGMGAADMKEIAPFTSYSFGVKGLYGGISLDGEIVKVRDQCNEDFYGKKCDQKEILTGKIKMDENKKVEQLLFKSITKILNENIKKAHELHLKKKEKKDESIVNNDDKKENNDKNDDNNNDKVVKKDIDKDANKEKSDDKVNKDK